MIVFTVVEHVFGGSMAAYPEMDENFEWYKQNLLNLYLRFGPCHAIIRNREVVGVFDTFNAACDMADKCFEPGTYNIQEIGPDESAYTVGWLPC